MAKTKTKTSFDARFRKGDKVIATVDLPRVPEGTNGKVKLVNGLTWTRYWVFFDNGVDLGQISQSSLVRAKQWAAFQEHRLDAANTSGAPAAGQAAATPEAGGDAPAAGSRIPEHLLERTRNRKKALGIG